MQARGGRIEEIVGSGLKKYSVLLSETLIALYNLV